MHEQQRKGVVAVAVLQHQPQPHQRTMGVLPIICVASPAIILRWSTSLLLTSCSTEAAAATTLGVLRAATDRRCAALLLQQ